MRAGSIGNDLDQCVAQEPSEESIHGNLHRGLPFFGIVFCLGQFSDVLRGVADRGDLATSGKHDRIEKPSFQGHKLCSRPTLREPIRALLCQLHVGT